MLVRLLRAYLRPYRRQIALLVVLLVGQTIGNLYLPNLNADIINNGVVTGNLHYILTTGEWMLALTMLIGVFSVIAVYWASRVAMGAGADIRQAVFTRVQAFSARDMNHFGTSSLITRNTNDIQQIQLFLQMALTMMVIAPIMCVGGIAAAREIPQLFAGLASGLHMSQAQVAQFFTSKYPAFAQLLSGFPTLVPVFKNVAPGLAHYGPLVTTMQANVSNYAKVDSLPNFRLFTWFFEIPGVLLVIFSLLGLGLFSRPRAVGSAA